VPALSEVSRVPLSEISRALAQRAEAAVRHLGLAGHLQKGTFIALNPTRSDRNLGSFRIELVGPKAGMWIDHATRDSGDLLDLFAYCLRLPLKDAIAAAKRFLGLPDDQIPGAKMAPAAEADADDAAERSRVAKKIWLAGQEKIAGTPVDAYLRHRGINLAELGRQPRALRFHPALWCAEVKRHLPAMVAAITRGGVHVATHRTWLAERDGVWRKAELQAAKKAMGPYWGGHLAIWRGASGRSLAEARDGETVAIAEGIETALSVAFACPELRVLAAVALGNMGQIHLPDTIGAVILCADNDEGRHDGAVRAAGERYAAEGRVVRIAVPDVPGADWNDVLQGVEG
jgi:phage/plasmid primase-like uncharacterized protein